MPPLPSYCQHLTARTPVLDTSNATDTEEKEENDTGSMSGTPSSHPAQHCEWKFHTSEAWYIVIHPLGLHVIHPLGLHGPRDVAWVGKARKSLPITFFLALTASLIRLSILAALLSPKYSILRAHPITKPNRHTPRRRYTPSTSCNRIPSAVGMYVNWTAAVLS